MKLEYIIFTFSFLYFGFSSPSHPVPSAGAEDGPTGENNFYTLYILTETFLPVERILVLRWELVTDPSGKDSSQESPQLPGFLLRVVTTDERSGQKIIIKIQNINKYKFPSCHYIILHIFISFLGQSEVL